MKRYYEERTNGKRKYVSPEFVYFKRNGEPYRLVVFSDGTKEVTRIPLKIEKGKTS